MLLEVERLLEVSEKPKYLLMENVKNLVGKKNKPDFDRWCEKLESMGYTNYWQVLNAKYYGIPQNRERVFMISILGEHEPYEFPEGFDNGIRLKDMLEDEVDEKFYISGEKIEKLISQLDNRKSELFGVDLSINDPRERDIANCIKARYDAGVSNFKQDGTGVAIPVMVIDDTQGFDGVRTYYDQIPTLRSQRSGLKVKQATNQGYDVAYEYDSINLEQPNSKTRRGRVGRQIANTLTCGCNQAVVEPNDYRIRKLTPLEFWRLMGFDDEHFQAAQDAGISNSQLYKQAGNSIVVDVLEYIFMNLFEGERDGLS